MELKKKVIRGVAWSTAEKVCSALLQVGVSLVLLNMLLPENYGTIAILTAFVSMVMPLVDSGFSQALIRKTDVSEDDLSSVFYVNISISVLIYIILLSLSPFIARYFEDPVLGQVAPILFLLVLINPIANIQSTIFTRNIDFKRLSTYIFISSVVSSIGAVAVALMGYGVWALVAQRLLLVITRTVLLWFNSSWRPRWTFSFDSIKNMFRYGSRILLSDIICNVYYQISSLFIGKMYSATQLGYYDRGNKIKELPVSSTVGAVQSVTFPALSQLQNDERKMCDNARKVYLVWMFAMFPLMMAIIMLGEDCFRLLLPERWLPAVPYLQILCIAGFFSPLSVLAYNLVKIKSDGNLIFIIELVKRSIDTLILVLTIPVSVTAIAWGQVAIFFVDMVVNHYTAHHLLRDWRFWPVLRDALPYLLFTVIMGVSMWFVGVWLAELPLWLLVMVKIAVGGGLYAALSRIFSLKAWWETREIIFDYIGKFRK